MKTSFRRIWHSWWRHRVENTSVFVSVCLWILEGDFGKFWWCHNSLLSSVLIKTIQNGETWQFSQTKWHLVFVRLILVVGKIEVFELGLMSLPGLNLFVVRCWRLTEDFDLNWQLDWSFLWKIDELETSLQSWSLNSGLDWTLLWHGFLEPGLPPRNKVKTRLRHLVDYSNMVFVFSTW